MLATVYKIDPADWLSSVGPPFQHQVVGVKFLLSNRVGLLADEMGSGKTRQLLDTACILWEHKEIDTVLVVAPSSVKTTWKSEIELHSWVPTYSEEYAPKIRQFRPPDIKHHLHIIITNYEFIRVEKRLTFLLNQLRTQNRHTMLVFDESSYIKSHRAAQTKAAAKLRQFGDRVYLCNGTPIANSLIDLYAPFAVLDKSIVGAPNYWAFRNRYCVMGGYQNKQIIGYRNIEHLQQRLKPYILRRLKDDCLDLPPKLYATANVPLCDETWRLYQELKEAMIAWLDTQTPIVTMNTIVKLVRMSQLTSGMIGGMARAAQLAANLGFLPLEQLEEEAELLLHDVKVVSNEKHQFVMTWLLDMVKIQPNFRAILWTRFRKEQEILKAMLDAAGIPLVRIYGGQNKVEREHVIRVFNEASDQPLVLLGQPKAGGIGTNLQAQCGWAVYVSCDYSLLSRLQSEDRIHRPGQRHSVVNYLDVLATGPKGQKTLDHAIKKALRNKEDLATKTTAFWRASLLEE